MKNLLTLIFSTMLPFIAIGQHFRMADVPEWVTTVEPPSKSSVSKYDVMSGGYLSLIDNQYNFTTDDDFRHVAIEILTHGGVQNASEVKIPFDSTYQTVQFHYLYVWRENERINKTAELSFELVRNEESLQHKIYTGQVTAYDALEDIRKGDRLEYAFTVHGSNPIFQRNDFHFIPFESDNPVDRYHVRFIHDTITDYITRCHACDSVSMIESDTNGFHIIELDRYGITASDLDHNTPPWHMPFSYFTISSFKNWTGVAQWAKGVFATENNPQTIALADKLKNDHPAIETQITEAVNYVQDQIRYMGMENGIGSIMPSAPDKVLKQRFGDCKDKSLLLVTLLHQLGVTEAYPALVNSQLRQGVANMLPSSHVFDHCIVFFRFNGKDHWIDPTAARQGGKFSSKRIADYGNALIVGSTSDSLAVMQVDDLFSRTERTEEFTAYSFHEPCTLVVTTKLYGTHADGMRALLEHISSKELTDRIRKDFSRGYPNIRSVGNMTIEDNETTNILSTTETYVIADFWKEVDDRSYSGWYFKYEPIDMYSYVYMHDCNQRNHPFLLPHPINVSQFTIFNVPRKESFKDEEAVFDTKAFNYHRILRDISPTKATVAYVYMSKKDQIQPEDFEKTCMRMNEMTNQMPVVIACPKMKNQY